MNSVTIWIHCSDGIIEYKFLFPSVIVYKWGGIHHTRSSSINLFDQIFFLRKEKFTGNIVNEFLDFLKFLLSKVSPTYLAQTPEFPSTSMSLWMSVHSANLRPIEVINTGGESNLRVATTMLQMPIFNKPSEGLLCTYLTILVSWLGLMYFGYLKWNCASEFHRVKSSS